MLRVLVWLVLLLKCAHSKELVWLDFDPAALVLSGLDVDDDLALASLLSYDDQFQVIGISAVGGNAPLRHTLWNAQALVKLFGLDVTVQPGMAWRLPRWNVDDSETRRETEAARAIVQAVHKYPEKSITLLAVGPLSNVAAALELDTSIASKLKRLVSMGGDLSRTKLDLNYLTDSSAVNRVLKVQSRHPFPYEMVPVQLCAQVAITSQDVESMNKACACEDQASSLRGVPCEFIFRTWAQTRLTPQLVNHKFVTVPPMSQVTTRLKQGFVPWDVVAVLVITRPELFSEERIHLGDVRVDNFSMQYRIVEASQAQVSMYRSVRSEMDVVHEIVRSACVHKTRRRASWMHPIRLGLFSELFAFLVVLPYLLASLLRMCR